MLNEKFNIRAYREQIVAVRPHVQWTDTIWNSFTSQRSMRSCEGYYRKCYQQMQLLKIKELCLPLNVVVGRDNPTFVCVFAFHQLGSPIFSTLCVSWCDRCRIREVGGWFYPNLQWGLLKRTRMVRVKRVTPQLGVSFVLSQGIFYMVLHASSTW